MERIIKINAKENFINHIANFLISLNKDNVIVIFPNIRPSHFLKKELSKIKASPTIIPKIYSLDNFITENYLKNTGKTIADIYDAFYIFHNFFRKDIQKIYKRKVSPDDIEKITPILWSEFEELKINKISPEKIKEYDFILSEVRFLSSKKSSLLELTEEKLFRYSKLYEKFYEKIEEERKTTRSVMYFDLSQDIGKLNIKNTDIIVIAGFFSTTKSEKDLFLKIKENFNSYFFFQEHELLDEQISYLNPPKNLSFNKFDLNFKLKASPSKHSEIFALKKDIYSISEIKDGKITPPPSCAIIMPDPTSLWPVIENILFEVTQYNITLQCSITNTPWLSLFEIISQININKNTSDNLYPIDEILSLFSHPYIKNSLRDDIIENGKKRFETHIKKDEIKKRFFKQTNIADEFLYLFIDQFDNIKNIKNFLQAIEKIIKYIKNKTTDKDNFIEISNLIETEILKIKSKKINNIKFKDFKTYFIFLKKMLQNISFPFKGEPIKGLQCMGILEARNLSFENVFIIDANDGIIPYEKKDICILTDMVRKKLGLPIYKDIFNLYYYHLSNIIINSKNSTIYFIENKKMMKSPVIEKMVWELEKKQNKILDISTTVYPRFEFSTKKPIEVEKDERIKEILLNFTYSSTLIDTYIECPLIFYYQYVVGIKKQQETQIIEKSDIGNIFHKTLEKTLVSYQQKRFFEIEKDKFIETFQSKLNEIITEEKLNTISPQIYFIKRQFLIKANELIDKMNKDFKSYEIKYVEYTHSNLIDINSNKIKIKGRADLIIENNNETIIIDFKTSTEPKNHLPKFSYFDETKKALTPGSIQMPFYLMLFSKFNNLKLAVISLGSKNIKHEFLYDNENEILTYQPKIEEFIKNIIKEIIEKEKFEPSQKAPCEECIYSDICSIL